MNNHDLEYVALHVYVVTYTFPVESVLEVSFADSNIIALLVYAVIFWSFAFFFWCQNGVLSGRGGLGCGVVGFFRLFCL